MCAEVSNAPDHVGSGTAVTAHESISLQPRTVGSPDLGESATADFFRQLYSQIRVLAAAQLRQERPGHTLQPTALVHEVYLRLVRESERHWLNEQQFLAVVAEVARRILIDHARARMASKRGGLRARREPLEVQVANYSWNDLLTLDEALTKLSALDVRQSRVAALRVFGGLTNDQIATALGVSRTTVVNDWVGARAWLTVQFNEDGAHE